MSSASGSADDDIVESITARQQLDRWAAEAKAGSHESFRQIVLATQAEVRLAIAARLRVPDLIEELVHRTYIAAWQSLSRYAPMEGSSGGLPAWLCAIARHQVLQEVRLRARRRHQAIADIGDLLCDDMQPDANDDDSERIGRLRRCLAKLPARAAEIIRRRYGEGHDLARLAIAYKQSVGSLAQQLQRLRQRLRSCVEGAGS